MNPLRHDFIRSCRNSSRTEAENTNTVPPPSYSYLDIGCGGGIFASSAARLPTTSTVTAIDPTELVIQVAKSHQRSDPAIAAPKLRYLNCAIEDLPVPSTERDKVDVLTIFEVLEHIDSPSAFLELAIPHLRPGGWIIGSTISRSPVAYLTTKLVAEAPLIGVVPAGTHDWNKYINPSELRHFFETRAPGQWGQFRTQGVMYIPMLGWKTVDNSEELGNYFFGVQKLD
jgi:ubiquinone biosynthesis O-methyltransferase